MRTDPPVQPRTTPAPLVSRTGAFRKFRHLEEPIAAELRRVSLPLLRCALGVVFVWFGVLKVVGASPAAGFVAGTLPWFDPAWLVPALGLFEMAVGVAVALGRFLVLVCVVLAGHLTGTFLSLFMQSEVTFQHGNPLLLTMSGEFVVKNLVLVAAVLVLAAGFDRRRA
jgi:uncharacterized membrane protein YphA (DoxX/SURF4 family)